MLSKKFNLPQKQNKDKQTIKKAHWADHSKPHVLCNHSTNQNNPMWYLS